ncbi:hypothetical protein MOQ_001556 [Trypanosoma cruzi marinkellei]|uniref:CRAL-TRIO domain-containing protein n=1 Tax=Trypanosoma cruzi marinkellei TaxID=85056 RepID=K2NT80_TRYCR|nr:hypothetical protein MOQ_001556 [Trypanosoma cruzi marinkellei]
MRLPTALFFYLYRKEEILRLLPHRRHLFEFVAPMEDALAAELGPVSVSHRAALGELKRRLGICHTHFDCWLYAFLENKKFDVDETIAKLQRRAAMEVQELGAYDITASGSSAGVGENACCTDDGMARGVIQIIGCDRRGRVCLYVTTVRDTCEKSLRAEKTRTFDAILSYATRLRHDHKSCRVVMLVNQKDASLLKHIDFPFQVSIALRISKYYPGLVERVYIVNMSRLLAAVAKSVFKGLPRDVSERICIVSDTEMKQGTLLQWFDAAVLPVALGGTMDRDTPEHWRAFADTVMRHFRHLQDAVVLRGMSVKEWELEELQRDGAGGGGGEESPVAHASPLFDAAEQHRNVSGAVLAPRASLSSGETAWRARSPGDSQLRECLALEQAYTISRDEIVESEFVQRSSVVHPAWEALRRQQWLQCHVRSRHHRLTVSLAEERRWMVYVTGVAGALVAVVSGGMLYFCCLLHTWVWCLFGARWAHAG